MTLTKTFAITCLSAVLSVFSLPALAADSAPAAQEEKQNRGGSAKRTTTRELPAGFVFSTEPLLDPNTASADQLQAVEGISAEDVQAIIDGRPYTTPTELHEVIGQGMTEEEHFSIYGAVFVKVNLNKSDTADFELVPSTLVGRKLAREFEEYRPYKTMNDFSREMGKYVSEEEVAFLQRYVTID